MTFPARPSLAAPRGHALAEAVRLAFEARGTDLTLVPVQGDLTVAEGEIRLTMRHGVAPATILRDPLIMLELAEDLHPDQPLHPRDPIRRAQHRQALAVLPRIARLIDRLSQSSDPRDVDLQVYHLRDLITQLAPVLTNSGTPGRAYSLADLAAAPLLWRIAALDETFSTYLLSGFDALGDRLNWLLGHAQVRAVLDPAVRSDWIGAITSRGALTRKGDERPDWAGALGHKGPNASSIGKDVPLSASTRKVRSIGTIGRIR
jgi:hypothetical protein